MSDQTETKQTTSDGEATPQVSDNSLESLLQSIKAPDGRVKYSTPADAIKSIPHKEEHIQTLTQELAALKEELARRQSAEEILNRIEEKSRNRDSVEQPSTKVQSMDDEQLSRIIEAKLQAQQQRTLKERNVAAVVEQFRNTFGEKANEMYSSIAKANGLGIDFLNEMAATAPEAVFNLAGIGRVPKNNPPAKTSSSVNTDAFNSSPVKQELSGKVPKGATTRDMVTAWRNIGLKLKEGM